MTRGAAGGGGEGAERDNMALLRIDLAFGKWKFKRNEKWFWDPPPHIVVYDSPLTGLASSAVSVK